MTKAAKTKFSPWGLCEAAGALACVCSAAAFFGSWHWLLELTTHWRLQYAAVLAVLSVAVGLAGKHKPGVVFGVFALANMLVVLPPHLPGGLCGTSRGAQLRVMLLNVHTENVRYDAVLQEVLAFKPDVLVLEEVNEFWLRKLRGLETVYACRVCAAQEDNFGIALFSRLPLKSGRVLYLGEAGVPSVQGIVTVDGQDVLVVGTHPLPPSSAENARLRNEQLEALARHLAAFAGPKALVGDLNLTPWSPYFGRLLRASGLGDTGNGRGFQPTWPARLAPLWIPIDHCLASSELRVLSRRTGQYVGSDHYALVVDVAPH